MASDLPLSFDTGWRAHSPAMNACVERLRQDIARIEVRQRSRRKEDAKRYRLSVECLLCNVAALSFAAPGCELEVRKHTTASRLSPVFGRGFNAALTAAEQLGLLAQCPEQRIRTPQGNFITLSAARALPAAAEWLPPVVTLDDLRLVSEGDALELRSAKDSAGMSKRLPIPHTREARRLAAEMAAVNAYLASVPLHAEGQQYWTKDSELGHKQRLRTVKHVFMRRVFNNGTLKHGGRLYDGWWENMPKLERSSRIRLAGEPVAEVDFNEMFLRLAYRHVGAPWPFSAGEDAYTAADYGARKQWKGLVNALLFNQSPLRQFTGSLEERQDLRAAFGCKPTEVYAAIGRKHPALAGAFGCGLGHTLARVESDLMVSLLLRLQEEGIAALPIHDCCVVARSQAQRAAELMELTAVAVLGCPLPVSISCGVTGR